MSSIGYRLEQERKKLGLNQEEFGLIGGVKRQAQGKYEADERRPDADYFAAIASAGADVLYILTGDRSCSSNPQRAADLPDSNQPVQYEPHAMEIAIECADLYIRELNVVLSPQKKAKLIRILYEDILEDEDGEIESGKVIDLIELASQELQGEEHEKLQSTEAPAKNKRFFRRNK